MLVVVAACVGVGVGLVGVGSLGSQELDELSVIDTLSIGVRIDGWGRTARMFMDYPMTGTGLGTFECRAPVLGCLFRCQHRPFGLLCWSVDP